MLTAEVKMNFDLGKFKLDMSPELNQAGNIVKRDIQQGIASAQCIDGGGRLAPLAPATVAAKIAKGGMSAQHAHDILIDTENLWRNQKIKKATAMDQAVEITIGPTREEIAGYLQEGTDKMPARPFFGISPGAENDVMRMVELTIERELTRL